MATPINAVKIFSEKCVDELCIQDIEASKKGSGPDFDLLSEIATEAFMPLSYGGGITTIEQIRRLFHIGFEKVILNTAWQDNPSLLREASEAFGAQSIVASIDVKQDVLRRNHCVTCGGTRQVEGTPVELARRAEEAGAGEILLNSIDRDGRDAGVRSQAGQERSRHGFRASDRLRRRKRSTGYGNRTASGGRPRGGRLAACLCSMDRARPCSCHVPEEKELFELGVYRDA